MLGVVVLVVGVCKGREVLGAFYMVLWRGVFVGKKGGCGGGRWCWVGVDEEGEEKKEKQRKEKPRKAKTC